MKEFLKGNRRSLPRRFAIAAALLAAFPAMGQSLSTNPGNFPGMTCQQLWYIEQEVLAEGRVCLTTERARRAFRRAGRCISSDETILPRKAQDYLEQLRIAARKKGCSGF